MKCCKCRKEADYSICAECDEEEDRELIEKIVNLLKTESKLQKQQFCSKEGAVLDKMIREIEGMK